MDSYVASPELTDQPLLLKRLAAGDYSVTVKDLRAGRIMQKPLSGGRCVWLWTMTGPRRESW